MRRDARPRRVSQSVGSRLCGFAVANANTGGKGLIFGTPNSLASADARKLRLYLWWRDKKRKARYLHFLTLERTRRVMPA